LITLLFASLLLLAYISVAVFLLWFRHASIAALPQLDGELQISGLHQPVSVIRDTHGVPHITAADMHDLIFAQGFVTAQDRLWQMDINRRYGKGELSEVLGARTLKLDRQQRTLQLHEVAERAYRVLPSEEQGLLQDYADGVNALIRLQRNDLPIEFRFLRYQPSLWTPVDSLIIGVNISEDLNTQFYMEHEREALLPRLTADEIADLYPNTSWRDHPPQQETSPLDMSPSSKSENTSTGPASVLATLPAVTCTSCVPGSNDWVVSGAHTASGKPLLSNDMHLRHSIPNVWYEAHLHAGDFDVAGVTFPGLPFVVGGHNQRIAWGFTNVGPDVQDLFIERFNAAGQYLTPSGWQSPQHQREIIHVKGAPDVILDVAVTRHGPIVSSLFEHETRQLALQWTIYDPHAMSLAFLDLDRAQDWNSFTQAISHFGGAAQNIVYADVDGHIGYHAAGYIPIRASGDGLEPVAGEDDSHAWIGYVPFDQLPQVFDPPSGIIATANGRITPDGYKYEIADEWGAPYRTERIYRMLSTDRKLTPADMLKMQMDVHSEFDLVCADAFVYAVDHSPHASSRARRAADLMRGWNGDMDSGSAAAQLTDSSRRALWRLLLQPKLGADWEKYAWFNSGTALERLLTTRPQRWLPPGYSDFDSVLTAAVEAAVKKAPKHLRRWTWGVQNAVAIPHPIFGGIPLISRWTGIGPHPQSGHGSYTVKAAGNDFGASERETVDLSDLDRSTLNIVVGESGQPFSPHFSDQWAAWYSGKTFSFPFTDSAVASNAAHRLLLKP